MSKIAKEINKSADEAKIKRKQGQPGGTHEHETTGSEPTPDKGNAHSRDKEMEEAPQQARDHVNPEKK